MRLAGSNSETGAAFQCIGGASLQLREYAAAREAYRAVQEAGVRARDAALEGEGLIGAGCVFLKEDDVAGALLLFERATALAAEQGDSVSCATMASSAAANRARCLVMLGRAADATTAMEAVVSLRQHALDADPADADAHLRMGAALVNLGSTLMHRGGDGDPARARKLLNDALRHLRRGGGAAHMEHVALVNLTNLGDAGTADGHEHAATVPGACEGAFAELRESLRRCGRDVSSVCSICWEPVEGSAPATILPCFHAFHASCIHSWSANSEVPSCPECRLPY